MIKQGVVLAGGLLFGLVVHGQAAPTFIKEALQGEQFGLFPAQDFLITKGGCADCANLKLKQGLWYFRDDVLALPKAELPVAGYSKTLDNLTDMKQWGTSAEAKSLAYPSLVWLGSPQIADGVTLTADGKQVRAADGSILDFAVVPKIATNRSFFDASSNTYFANRSLRVRGSVHNDNGKQTLVARTIWPKDIALAPEKMSLVPLAGTDDFKSFVQAEQGGARSAFSSRLIWERNPAKAGEVRQWQDKAVLGFMLNGAQGDDDEAYGGHFGIVTGKYAHDGDWSNWMVNNFYNLDSVSEKGIIASMVPMDNYLMDLNSGQQYYRPSYMLVAVLNNPRTAVAYQGAVERSYNHFYRHDFVYQHAAANCAGISLDVFKSLGWNIPERGPTGYAKAIAAYGYVAAKDGSLTGGRKIYDYLTEETTHLLPAVAFDAAGQDLLALLGRQTSRPLGDLEKQLQSDVDALMLVRIPQIPSSRAFGSNPVFSFGEYMDRAPKDHAQWKIVPVDPRPFPQELRDGQALEQHGNSLMPLPVAAVLAALVLAIVAGLTTLSRKRKSKGAANRP